MNKEQSLSAGAMAVGLVLYFYKPMVSFWFLFVVLVILGLWRSL